MTTPTTPTRLSRRTLLASLAGSAALAGLPACAAGGSTSGDGAGAIKFWEMPMGNAQFNTLDRKIVEAYKPEGELRPVQFQLIQWNNFTQTFAAAAASGTGPAVSSGGGTQAFQYAAAGKIAYADELVEKWRSNGLLDDFLPGLVDALKTPDGHHAAVPQNVDMIILWYSPSLLKKAEVSAPTDWQSYLDVGKALKGIGVYGFGTGAGSGNFQGSQTLTSLMIANGGGLFDEDQQPACVTPQNIEAVDFVLEMVAKNYVAPGSTQYTNANVGKQRLAGKFGLGFDVMNLAGRAGKGFDGVVGSPLKAPSGGTSTLGFVNNIMMWKDTPDQKSSEAFLNYYYRHMAPLWTKGTMQALPPLKSIAETPEFRADPNHVKVIEEWQPVLKTWAAPGTAMSESTAAVDGSSPMSQFAQSVLGGKTTAKEALTKLQAALVQNIKNS